MSSEDQVIKTRGALVRIATLMLKVPKGVITQYLSEHEWKELVECYNNCRQLVPTQGRIPFEEKK